jgi:two-component system response regulator HydG
MATTAPAILVVDDDPDTCRNLADILTDLGYRVDTAPDGPAALELVRKNPYDVALLDFKMPGMDGLELYRRIKALRAGTVAIIVSAYTNPATRDEAIGTGAWRVLAKPVDFPNLLGLLDEALGQPLVLVVDDDSDLCQNLWDLLRERGYRVALARDGREAAEQLRGGPFKVVLIDMRLPDGDGSAVFQMVRKASPEAHTVVITGHPQELDELVQRVLREGADAVCYKPFDVGNLLATMEKLTREPPGGAGPPGRGGTDD